MNYETKDSGQHKQFSTGMMRDIDEGKPRFDLMIPKDQPYTETMLYRFAALLERGARKYSSRNWEKAATEEEMERAHASLSRHYHQYMSGEEDEDHAAAIYFNVMEIEYIKGRLREDGNV